MAARRPTWHDQCMADNRRIIAITVKIIDDPDGDSSYLSEAEDRDRLEALHRGDWGFVGVRAQAQAVLDGNVVQDLTSGGLWSIESDSDKDHFREVGAEELSTLKDQLRAVGFSDGQIEAVEVSWPDGI
jgi:hypothetical protein